MKKWISIILIILLVFAGAWFFFYSISSPYWLKVLRQYNMQTVDMGVIPLTSERVLVVGYAAKDRATNPNTFIAIYKLGGKLEVLYRYSPVVPKAVDFPSPLQLEQADVVEFGYEDASNEIKNNRLFIVSSWGETGADYFGTCPIVIGYVEGGFQAIPFYPGNVSDNPQIKDSSWMQIDFIVSNYFDPSEKVKTILTQGVGLDDAGNVVLTFYGDNKPHAVEHTYVNLKFPLPFVIKSTE